MKEDTSVVLKLLQDRAIKEQAKEVRRIVKFANENTSVFRLGTPLIVKDYEAQLTYDKMVSLGRVIAELDIMLSKLGEEHDEFARHLPLSVDPVEMLKHQYKTLIEAINTRRHYNSKEYGEVIEHLSIFQNRVFDLDNFVVTADAMSIYSPTVQESHIQRRITIALNDSERLKIRLRQASHFKHDEQALHLVSSLLTPLNADMLDANFAQLMYLAGLDFEIYNRDKGNLDVLLYSHVLKAAWLVETTTGKVDKKKVDQIVGRLREYIDFFAEVLDKITSVHLLIVTTQKDNGIDSMARKEALFNKVTILSARHLKGLTDLLRKGILDYTKVQEMIANT